MKKLLALLVVPMLLLTACGESEPEPKPDFNMYNLTFIGGPEYHGWFDDVQENMNKTENIYTFNKVDSVYNQQDAIQQIVNSKKEGVLNAVLIGFGPNDYVGGTLEAAEENVAKNEAYIDELAAITLPNEVILMVANGFPKLEEESDEHLLWNHVQMKDYLAAKFEETNDYIVNFAIRRSLSYKNDYLRTEFINEDGSLNNDAYIQLNTDLTTYLGLLSKRKNE